VEGESVTFRPDRRDLVLHYIALAREELARAERAVHLDDLDLAELECSAAKRASRNAEDAACTRGERELVEVEFYSPHDDKYGINRCLTVRSATRSVMTGAGNLRYALREFFGPDRL
jgi:hypothetical protein